MFNAVSDVCCMLQDLMFPFHTAKPYSKPAPVIALHFGPKAGCTLRIIFVTYNYVSRWKKIMSIFLHMLRNKE